MQRAVYAIATMDTKADEIEFVAQCLRAAGVEVQTVDVGTATPPSRLPDIPRSDILDPDSLPSQADRGESIAAMSRSLTRFLSQRVDAGVVAGVIGIGGSGGTALITAAMRSMPIGLPKLMVSTVASGNVEPYIDCCDITMMYSVVDVAGLNVVSHQILSNAAHAMAGMVQHAAPVRTSQTCLGMTMFGVTTPCVTTVRESLEEQGFDCLVFHATGTGGRAMENLVRHGRIRGILDITTTEVADEIVGGIFPAGPDRFDSTIRSKLPFVLSVGAIDMVNFGALQTLPAKFLKRNLHIHNDQITLMRTSVSENVAIAKWIAQKLNQSNSAFTFLLPEGGVSMLDAPGAPFHDPEANRALFETLESELNLDHHRTLIRCPYHINEPAFAQEIVNAFLTMSE
ncbi:MAG: Tm-1-like ATP-binding domain-containing protein [Planctomycetota bacterium]